MAQSIPEHVIVALTSAGTEYSWNIPYGCIEFTIQIREGDTVLQYYFVANASGGGPGQNNKYFTLPAGASKTFGGFHFMTVNQTMYFQAVTNAGKTLEIEYLNGYRSPI